MKNSKKVIILMMGLVLSVFIVFVAITIFQNKSEDKQSEENEATFTSIEEPESSYLVADETVGIPPLDMSENPYRVMLSNPGDLLDLGIQYDAFDYLEPYLNEYFNYYLDNGTNYFAEYVEDTFVPDINFPTFHIYIEELDLDIECVYITSKEYYRFTSRFNPNGE